MPRSVDVGYSRVRQFSPDSRHIHEVKRNEESRTRLDAWVTVCGDQPAVRMYRGWLSVVTCPACIRMREPVSA